MEALREHSLTVVSLSFYRIKRNKAAGPRGVAAAGVTRHHGIRIDRQRALGNAIGQALRDQHRGRLAIFHPIFKESESVEIGKAGSAGAMMDTGNQEEPEKVFGLLPAAHCF